jgi:hypothetical protein
VIGAYHHGLQVGYLPEGWTAQRDGSLHSSRPNAMGCEIVSPVLKGAEGLAQVAEVLQVLQAKGHRVNACCGVHVHVGWAGDERALARLVTIASYCEKGIYAVTGTKSRERGAYCGGVRKYGNEKKAQDEAKDCRYHLLNLANLGFGKKNTVEFRAFSGSLEVIKVLGWIQLCLGLVTRALVAKKAPKWVPAAPGGQWAKSGPGASETERMLAYLGWANGYARAIEKRQYGWLAGEVAGLPSQDATKAEFRRLAKKYDAMP